MCSLGIDVGTTSIKITLADEEQIEIGGCSVPLDAEIGNCLHPEYHEQNVVKIIKALENCIYDTTRKVRPETFEHVDKIAVCGQMHGCVLWNEQSENTQQTSGKTSNLFTWRDGRCTEEFLKTLPNSQTNLSTGFGCATLLWLRRNNQKFLEEFNCCGTIADYIVAKLTQNSKPPLSYQNANSWGYFNVKTSQWDLSALEAAKFPMHLLPEVVPPGTIAGRLANRWHGIREGTKVFVAMGDMQCSVLACRPQNNEAVMYVGTSSQISLPVSKVDTSMNGNAESGKPSPVSRVPYFGDQDLLTFASLNGGAVFAEYVRMLLEWTKKFDRNVTEDDVYARLMEDNPDQRIAQGGKTAISFTPTMFGERHAPDLKAVLRDIDAQNFNAPDIGRAIAAGILRNLRSVFDDDAHGFTHVWVCGGVFSKNRLFREEVNNVFADKVVSFSRSADAAYGAAISVCNLP